ncbi:MogA/MoaB family molybdenum cofactor biosynthesis protein [Halostella salina]|uniref:MogA/MoaB family molybdenum cofactor biosynthesis protein n=1 Tax=Halostella salina TaxID=1547897 RepID=UPI000EF7B0E6|nr:molybdenum cofactor synthesis domain-containing protein [Halostella salina]
MVDFQSRDTRRGLDEDEEDEPDEEAESEVDDGAEPDSDGATEPGEETVPDASEGDPDPEPADAAAGTVPEADGSDAEGAPHGRDDDSGGHDPGGTGDHDRDDGGHDANDHGHGDHAHADHHHHDVDTLGVAVVTVSSSRTLSDDPAGDTITETMEAADDEVVTRELIPDDYDRIEGTLSNLVGREDVDIVVTTGGTGVTPDDVTIEAAKRLFDKELPGFGELFRLLSYDEIGTKVVATRATAGIVDGVPVFCLPGSENAALLGAETIISEEAAHIAGLANRDE